MDKLIKSIMEQLALVSDKRLAKADEPAPVAPKVPHGESNRKLTQLFGQLDGQIKAGKTGKTSYVNGARGAIRSYALGLPKGQIDLGHFYKLVNAQNTHSPPGPSIYQGRAQMMHERPDVDWGHQPITHKDMMEIVNHHISDAPSMKHIHDHNGGIPAVEMLARTMGANGDPPEYSDFKLKPQLHAELLDLVNPGKHKWSWATTAKHTSPYEDTHIPEHDEAVGNAHEDMMSSDDEGNAGFDNEEIRHRLTDTATARAVARFKKYHGID